VTESESEGLTENERVGHYIEMWKQAVQVQQHFNDIEWRIRGLALTVATFALGAAGLAAKDRTELGGVSLGALVTMVGLILWYAFYFVDRAWYHPLLKASVKGGTRMEDEIRRSLPEADLTRAITAGSPFRTSWLVHKISRKPREMQSEHKLVWFYVVGAVALAIVTVALQLAAFFYEPTDQPANDVVVHVDSHPGRHLGRP
jgi:hypothetical protein